MRQSSKSNRRIVNDGVGVATLDFFEPADTSLRPAVLVSALGSSRGGSVVDARL